MRDARALVVVGMSLADADQPPIRIFRQPPCLRLRHQYLRWRQPIVTEYRRRHGPITMWAMDAERTALLIMDVQPEIVARFADSELTEALARAAAAARAAGVRVIYVKVGFREGYPEISPRSATFSRIAELGGFVEGVSSDVHPAVAPQQGDVVVTKRRVSAFAGSDLDMVLRAGRIEALVLSGIATSGVVLSTLRQAADLDFSLTVLCDGCLDADDEVHRVLCEKVFPRQARVLTISEWIDTLAQRE